MCHPVTDLELDLAQLARDRGNYIDYFDCLELSTTADDMGQQYLVDRRYRHRYRIVSPKPAVTDDRSGHNNYDYQPLLHLRRLRHVEAIGKKKLAFWFNGGPGHAGTKFTAGVGEAGIPPPMSGSLILVHSSDLS